MEKVAQYLQQHSTSSQAESNDVLNGLRILSSNADPASIDGDDGENSKILAQLTTMPENVEAAVQDEAPNLWSLFTELAGPQGLYCDRVSQGVLALLINGRRC